MVSKRILSFIVAGSIMFGAIPAFANPNVTTQPEASTSTSGSNVVQDAVCDPSIFARIKQKGWMEAQRENYINQSIIKRPVNTFAATCFDKQLGLAMNRLGVAQRKDTDPDTAAETLEPFQTGVVNSSGNVVAGLIGPLSGGKPLLPGSGVGSTPTTYNEYTSPPTPSDSFSCNAMNQIWDNVSCENMAGSDLPSLGEVATGDESRTSGTKTCSNGTMDRSTSEGEQTYNYETAIAEVYKPAEGDNATDLFLCRQLPYSQLAAAGCPQTCGSFTATGSRLNSGKPAMTCLNNCKYEASSGTCVPPTQ